MVAHHASLVGGGQRAVVEGHVVVAACSVTEVGHVLWVECSLQIGKTEIGLSLVWVVHLRRASLC